MRAALRWFAPSAAAACLGAVVAGVCEAVWMSDLLTAFATIGYLSLIAVPPLFVGAIVARGLWRGWQPDAIASTLVEDGGGAPRLAGWLAMIWLGVLVLAWIISRAVGVVASNTEMKPMTVSFVMPAVAVVVCLLLVAVARPLARLFAHAARRVDARWRARGRGTLLSPRALLGVSIVFVPIVSYAVWRLVVRPQIGPFATSVLIAPAIAVVACIAAHVVWTRIPRLVGWAAAVIVASAITTALVMARTHPNAMLEIWSEQPLAGLAIDKLFDIQRVRSRMSLAAFKPAGVPGVAHPDILLVTIDTTRADYTPPYGGSVHMPALARLGETGAVFEWAFAPSNVTRRSIPSMVIGLQPDRVRGRVVGWALRVDPRHVLLAERLRAGGYDTAGFMCCAGFWGEEARTGLSRGLEHVVIDSNGPRLAKSARAWLEAREKLPNRKPLFFWMHIIEPHNWLANAVDPNTEEGRRTLYGRSLQVSDSMLADVIAPFVERKPDMVPIVVVTADHGESLGEHGAPYHSTDLYNSQLRVPFVIAGAGIAQRRIGETVSLTDIVPTLVELAGFAAPLDLDGRSIADLATGRRAPDPEGGTAFAAMIKDRSNPGGLTTLIRGRYKIIDNGVSRELYDIRTDPNELRNIIADKPDIARELERELAARLSRGSPF